MQILHSRKHLENKSFGNLPYIQNILEIKFQIKRIATGPRHRMSARANKLFGHHFFLKLLKFPVLTKLDYQHKNVRDYYCIVGYI